MAGAKSQKRFRLSRRPPSARPSRRGVCGRLLRRTHTSRAAGSKAWGSHLPSKMRLANAKPLSALTNAARMPRRAYRRNAFSETGRGIGRRRRSKNADERICHQQYIETAAAPNRRCSVSRSLKSTVSDRSPAHRVRAQASSSFGRGNISGAGIAALLRQRRSPIKLRARVPAAHPESVSIPPWCADLNGRNADEAGSVFWETFGNECISGDCFTFCSSG